MDPIFIIGYMASGKTTFGRALARHLGLRFIDLDFYIEQRFHASVAQIFAEKGEERFREIEREILRETGEFSDVVISCGGGTPCFHDNMDYINSRGLSVCLHAGVERTVERILRRPGKRPLTDGKQRAELEQYVAENLAKRHPFYSRAHLTIDSEELEDRRQIDRTVERFMKTVRDLLA